jgi:hypothetical protein
MSFFHEWIRNNIYVYEQLHCENSIQNPLIMQRVVIKFKG